MNRTFLTLTLAANLVAVGAYAQTTSTSTAATGHGMTSDTFGSDWSTTLGMAMFGEDGTTVRSDSEIAAQWSTLSDEDKDMIRRDCMAYMEHSGSTTGGTGSTTGTTGTTMGSTGTTTGTGTTMGSATGTAGSSGTTSATGSDASAPMISVTMEQMEEICEVTNDL